MKMTFNPAKDLDNIAKHGVSLADAEAIAWDTLWVKPDTRNDYGETRMIGFALIGTRLYCVVFTDRDDERRIISLRKANKREVKSYVINN